MEMTFTKESTCEDSRLKFGVDYTNNISVYLNVPIYIIGAIFNIFNLLVFTRQTMRSPVNLIFIHLTLADIALLVGGLPYAWLIPHYSGSYADAERTYLKAVIFIRTYDFTITAHFVSSFFTIQLAVWRYIAIAYPLKERQWCNMKTTRNVVIAGYIICVLLSIPMYITRHIDVNKASDDNQTLTYTPTYKKESIIYEISLIVNGVFYQLVPSVVLLIFSLKLIFVLLETNKHSEHPITESFNIQNNKMSRNTNQQTDRSISILLTVVALFLITKIPLGIVQVIITIDRRANYFDCYRGLIIILNTLNAFNLFLTFIVYYTMSKKFRITFKSLLNNYRNLSQDSATSTRGRLRFAGDSF